MIDLGIVKPGSTIRIPFSSYDKDDGSSITMTNYAAADILIYKNGSTTERASTAGFTATTDFDGKTGKHLAIIDLADNTTADFYNSGAEYLVAIDAVTVDAVTTGGWVARFVIGYPDAHLNTTIATLSTQTSFTLTAGPAEDDAINGSVVLIHDIASAVQLGYAVVADYTGSTKTVTLTSGVTFTAAAGDNISIFAPGNARWFAALLGVALPLTPTTAGRTLDVSAGGEAGIDWANIGSPTTAQNLSATNIDVDQIVASVSGAVGSVTGAVGSVTGNIGGNVVGSVASVTTVSSGAISEASFATTAGTFRILGIIDRGTAQAGSTASTFVARSGLSLANDVPNGSQITIASGTGAGQSRLTTDFVGATDTFSVSPDWTTTPDDTSVYDIYSVAPAVTGGSSPSAAEIADAVWDEAQADHVGAGSFGETATEIAAILVDTGTTLDGRIPAALVGGRMDSNLGAISADSGAADNAESFFDGTGYAGTGNVIPTVTAVTTVNGLAANVITAAATAADFTTEIQSGLATSAALDTVDNFLDTEVAAILAAVDTEVAAIKAKTDQLTFTTSNQVDATTVTNSDKTGYTLTADIRIKKNTGLNNFTFLMVDSSDVPATGLTVTAERSLDGGALASMANSVTEISNGLYKINLAAADTNADICCYRFTAATAKDRIVMFPTQTE